MANGNHPGQRRGFTMHTDPKGYKLPTAPKGWPFGKQPPPPVQDAPF